jgi:hypothetical protein
MYSAAGVDAAAVDTPDEDESDDADFEWCGPTAVPGVYLKYKGQEDLQK